MIHSSESASIVTVQVVVVYHAFAPTTHPEARNQNTQRWNSCGFAGSRRSQSYWSGPQYARLPMAGFFDDAGELAFGFLDCLS